MVGSRPRADPLSVAASVQRGFFHESLWLALDDQQPQSHDSLYDRRDRTHAGARRNLHAADHGRDDDHAAACLVRGRAVAQRDSTQTYIFLTDVLKQDRGGPACAVGHLR